MQSLEYQPSHGNILDSPVCSVVQRNVWGVLDPSHSQGKGRRVRILHLQKFLLWKPSIKMVR